MRMTVKAWFSRVWGSSWREPVLAALLVGLGFDNRGGYRVGDIASPEAQSRMRGVFSLQEYVTDALLSSLNRSHELTGGQFAEAVYRRAAQMGCESTLETALGRVWDRTGLGRYVNGSYGLAGRAVIDLIPLLDHDAALVGSEGGEAITLEEDAVLPGLDTIGGVAGEADVMMSSLMAPGRVVFLASLAHHMAVWAQHAEQGCDPGEEGRFLVGMNEAVLLVAEQLEGSFRNASALPDAVFARYVCGRIKSLPNRMAFTGILATAAAAAGSVEGRVETPYSRIGRVTRPKDGQSLTMRLKQLVTATSLKEALALRCSAEDVVLGGRVGACAVEAVTTLMATLVTGAGTDIGFGVCLDMVVEIAYGACDEDPARITECLSVLRENFGVLLGLCESRNALVVLSALELAWITGADKERVRRIAHGLQLNELSMEEEWPGFGKGGILMCLERLIVSMLSCDRQVLPLR